MTQGTLRDTRAQLGAVVAEVEATGEPYMVTRYGKPAAVIVSWADWEETTRTLAVLSRAGLIDPRPTP